MACDISPPDSPTTLPAEVLENLYNCIAVSEAVRAGGRIVDFRCTYVNRAYLETLRQTREEVFACGLLERYPGMKGSGLFDQLVSVVETGQMLDTDYHHFHDGLDMHVRLVGKKFGDGVLVAFHDIARRKRSETDLRRVNQELEERVEQRTRELRLAHERLQQALALAQQGNQAKSEFLAMVSHDLRSPLAAIQGYIGLLESESLSGEQAEQLRVIDHCADGLLRLLDDLLRFSRLEAGELTLENEPFLLQPVLEETLAIFRPAARQKHLDLQLEAAAGLPSLVLGDAAQFRRIFANLIGNAVKFTERGGVTVKARVEPLDTGEADWLFHGTVADTGPGLDPALAVNLFQPYHQGTRESRRKYGGVGLGLAICRRLCELMGGDITLDSAPGKGSQFNFRVRLGEVNPEA